MKNEHIIIAILLIVILFFIWNNNKEHLTGTEAVFNISKVYADASGTANFNNLNVTGTFNVIPPGSIIAFNSATAPNGWAVCDGQKYKLNSSGVAVVDANGLQTPDLKGRFIRSSYATTGTDINGDNLPIKITKAHDHPLNVWNRDTGETDKFGKMTEHKFGDFGGTDYRQQSVKELAKHYHIYRLASSSNDDSKGFFDMDVGNGTKESNGRPVFDNGSASVTGGPYSLNTWETGDNWGFGIQPPYYVLTYIMKI
jgi:hypothetical protein